MDTLHQVRLVGIDLSKHVFQIHAVDKTGKALIRRKVSRHKLVGFISEFPRHARVVMEACGSANHWGREFQRHGFTVNLIAPQYVKPYVKTNKDDRADAEAICEAALRPSMRFVPVKSSEQQDIQNLHRIRARLVSARTGLMNEIRGLLGEYGIIIPRGKATLRRRLIEILDDPDVQLSPLARRTFVSLSDELDGLHQAIWEYDLMIQDVFLKSPQAQALAKIEGIGALTATALVATVGNASFFQSGRHLAAWLGLVPKHSGTGGKEKMGRLSKRGNPYLRQLLIHGARSVVKNCTRKDGKTMQWLQQLRREKGFNKAAVALANKNARIVWALLQKELEYERDHVPATYLQAA